MVYLKKSIYIGIVLVILCGMFLAVYYIIYGNNLGISTLHNTATGSFHDSVITTEKTDLFKKAENDFIQIGSIEKDTYLNLEVADGEYFKLKDEPYYIYRKSVKKSESIYLIDNYTNTIDIKEKTYLCNLNGNPAIILEEGMSLKTERQQNTYYVIFNNSKYTLKQGENIFNTYEEKTNEVPVLMYHFFSNNYEEAKAASIIHLDIDTFENQLKYLKENNYYNPTMKELERFIDGEITLPKKSVILTIDDGALSVYVLAFPLLEKYDVNAVCYIITGQIQEKSDYTSWFMDKEQINEMSNSKNIVMNSHTHNMHGVSEDKTENRIDKVSTEFGVDDINKSSEVLKNRESFCYPFGIYNDNAKEILQKSGYTLAFRMNGGKVTEKLDKLELPRTAIFYHTTQNQFVSIVTNK